MVLSRASVFIPLLMAPALAVAADIPGGPGTSVTLGVGATVESELDSAADADWFRTSLQAGKLYAFTVATSAAGDDLEFRLSARDAAGRVLAAASLPTRGDWETRQLNFRPRTAGTHYLEVKGNSALPYLVGLFRDVSSSFDDAARLAFGTQVTGTMESNHDSDYYVVRLEKGKPIDLLLPSSGPCSTTVVLYDRGREPLGIVDGYYGKLAYHVPTYTGDHFISVSLPFAVRLHAQGGAGRPRPTHARATTS